MRLALWTTLVLVACIDLFAPAVWRAAGSLGFSFWMAFIPTLCYLAIVVEQAIGQHYPMALVYFGYSVANCGFMWIFAVAMAAGERMGHLA